MDTRVARSMGYRIREVDGDDHELELRALHDECFGDEAPQVDPAEGWWWIIYSQQDVDGRKLWTPAGFAGMKQSGSWTNAAYMHRAGVTPEHRGRGLQRRLIRVREKRARKIGYSYLVTDTTDNPESANNLIRCGFLTFRPDHKYGFINTIYWRKHLEGRRPDTRGAARERAEAHSAVPNQRAEDAGLLGAERDGALQHQRGHEGVAEAGSGCCRTGATLCNTGCPHFWKQTER